jgi:hypothetical protein
LIEIAADIKVFKELGMSMESEKPPKGFYLSKDKILFTDKKAETKVDTVIFDVDNPNVLDFPPRFGDLFPENSSNLEFRITRDVLTKLVGDVDRLSELEKSMAKKITP